MSEATAEELLQAKEKLGQAIKEYGAVVDPDEFIDDWCLVVHKDSVEMTKANQSLVSLIVPYGQAFHRTSGLMVEGAKLALGLGQT